VYDFNSVTANLTMPAAVHAASTFTNVAAGTQTVTIPANAYTSFAVAAGIDEYVLGDANGGAALAVTGVTGATGVNAVTAGDGVTVGVSGTYTGTLTGEANVADVVSVAAGTNISGATIGAGFVGLTIATGGTVTMTAAQYSAFTGTTTAAGTTGAGTAETVVLTTAATLTTSASMDSAVENITLANGTNVLTLAGTTAHTITGGTGADTVVITTGTTAINQTINFGVDTAVDRLSINNPGIVITETLNATVTNFNVANDAIRTLLNGTALTLGGYQVVVAGAQTASTALAGGIIEVEGSNLADFTATGNAAAVEAALLTAIAALADGSYTVVMYGSGNAAIYQMTFANDATAAGLDLATEITVEHLATLTGVTSGSLTSANFYS
jgi:hypothetical protein